MNNNKCFVSVLIPCRNEELYIESVIDSIINQTFDQINIEIIIIDGESIDGTQGLVIEYCKKHSNITLLNNEHHTVPFALNLGIQEAKGDIIVRMDAHAEYPRNYISTLVDNLFKLGADNVGGIVNTIPFKNSLKSISIAAALGSPFGVGNSHFRIGSNTIRQVDTVPFGCYRREVFDKIGMYDEDLTRNQDDEFNGRLIKNGGKIYLIPEIVIKYYSRDKVSKMAQMFYQYGLFKPLVNKKLGAPATLRQFFPLFFLLGLVLGIFPAFYSETFLFLYFFTLSTYMLLSVLFSIISAVSFKKLKIIFVLPFLFLIIHISYGFGYLIGIYNIIKNRKFNAEVNR